MNRSTRWLVLALCIGVGLPTTAAAERKSICRQACATAVDACTIARAPLRRKRARRLCRRALLHACRAIGETACVVTSTTATTSTTTTVRPTTTTRPGDDTDCLPGDLEDRLGLDRQQLDSDQDGTEDGAEDLDDDGVTNCREVEHQTALNAADTDQDGATDLEEITLRISPIDPDSRVLRAGDVVDAAIDADTRSDRFAFTLTATGLVSLRVADTSGTEAFVPSLTVIGSDGALAAPYRSGDRFLSLVYELGAGTYRADVKSADGRGHGTYRVQYMPLAEAPLLPISADPFVDDTLAGPHGLAGAHQFVLSEPRRVIVTLTAQEPRPPSFLPCFDILTAPSGVRVLGGHHCNGSRVLDLAAGAYLALVTDSQNDATGSYRLHVSQEVDGGT